MSRIPEILARRFPKNDYYEHDLGKLLSEYEKSGLASPHFVEEIESGEAGKLWARVWEAMLYRHLLGLGFQLHSVPMKKSGERGPDFGIVYQEKTIWIEAVTPSPDLKPVLDEEPLLRWTSVLRG